MKKSKVFLVSSLLFFCFCFSVNSQIKVSDEGKVFIGGILDASHNLEVSGDAGFRCGANSGFTFEEYSCCYPVLLPQWNNAMYLGTNDYRLRRVYTNYLYVNGVQVTSDRSIKENIRPLSGSLDALCSLPAVVFDFKAEIYNDSTSSENMIEELKVNRFDHPGFIAQDVQQVFPKLVIQDEDSELLSINYIGFIPQLVGALKEQQIIIDEQNQDIEIMKQQILQLQKSLLVKDKVVVTEDGEVL